MSVRRAGLLVAALALCLWPASARAADPSPEILARGKYVFATAGGCGCHTPPDAVGLNAGGQKFELLVGTVYSRNITPDAETGIGKWTDAQVANAIRRGERPDGSRLFPIHPYKYLANIADDEIEALVAYLRSVKPVKATVPARSAALALGVELQPVADELVAVLRGDLGLEPLDFGMAELDHPAGVEEHPFVDLFPAVIGKIIVMVDLDVQVILVKVDTLRPRVRGDGTQRKGRHRDGIHLGREYLLAVEIRNAQDLHPFAPGRAAGCGALRAYRAAVE